MNFTMRHRRWPALLVLAALALGTVAPVAEAGNGNGRGNGHGKGRGKGKGEQARVESTWRRSGGDRGDRTYARESTPRRTFREWNSTSRRDGGYRDRSYRDRSYDRSDRVVVRRESRPVYRDRVTYRPRTVYRERIVERPIYRSNRSYRGGYAPARIPFGGAPAAARSSLASSGVSSSAPRSRTRARPGSRTTIPTVTRAS